MRKQKVKINRDENNRLDGMWGNSVFNLIVKGNTYVSFYNGFHYGKGKIIYDNEKFILTSSHARWVFLWIPFVEIVTGKYIYTNDELAVSNIEGRYSDFNGIWVHIKHTSCKIWRSV
jgi:hypothetical protein